MDAKQGNIYVVTRPDHAAQRIRQFLYQAAGVVLGAIKTGLISPRRSDEGLLSYYARVHMVCTGVLDAVTYKLN
jgi:hypothetical protein